MVINFYFLILNIDRLKLYQVFLAFLKIDIFFFTAFAIQFLFFIISYLTDDDSKQKLYKFLNIGLLAICILMPFTGIAAITKENYKLMCVFILFLSISFGYMVYSLADIIIEKYMEIEREKSGVAAQSCIAGENNENQHCYENKYKNCTNSLLFACK